MTTQLNSLTVMEMTKKFSRAQNYLAWKTYQKQVLHSKGLFGYTNRVIMQPSSRGSSGVLMEELWEEQNGRAMARIAINCNDAIMIAVDAHDTANKAWDYLVGKYQNTSWLAKSLAKKHLTDLKHSDSHDMLTHIDTLNVQLSECKAIGITIADEDYCMIITNLLPVS